MSESASGVREARRLATAERISREARRLTDDHGLDGFTMDELAEASDVSRRTLFNYFPGKDAAVLGSDEPWDEDALEAFAAGGPTGHLVEDLAALVDSALRARGLAREELLQVRRILHDNPRLLTLAKRRFEEKVEHSLRLVERREGPAYDEPAARAAIHVFAALFDLCLSAYVDHDGRELPDLFCDAVAATRRAFA